MGRTEDQIRSESGVTLGFMDSDGKPIETSKFISGVGQITTFNQLGNKLNISSFNNISKKPDGWYLPKNKNEVAIVLETKSEDIDLDKQECEDEICRNITILNKRYNNVVGILYNGKNIRVFKNDEEVKDNISNELENKEYYLKFFEKSNIDKEYIYLLTARINNCLHTEFGIKNLYHRMIFTACALVAARYGCDLTRLKDMGYDTLHTRVRATLSNQLEPTLRQNIKINILLKQYDEIEMNNYDNQKAINLFIDNVDEISKSINSNEWRGEDVMGIFFNEFNRYKKKSDNGQVFTPEHITDFMYKILEVNKNDRILDAACGSGGFLVKAMSNMIKEAGGVDTAKASEIKSSQLFGIENDKEIYALACANMLIHKDGKTNLERMDSRTDEACKWIKKQKITKVLMNPPFERKYGCIPIVINVLDSVPIHTPCAFILPDKKLEKATKKEKKHILDHHKLKKVIKLPEDLFFGAGVSTSVFIFEAGVPQNNSDFFTCYMETDGLQTVKNKGRHDIYNKWPSIEDYWIDVISKQTGDDTCKWENPKNCLSYQVPRKPFEIYEEDFKKTALNYLMFKNNVNEKSVKESIIEKSLYSNKSEIKNNMITIPISEDENE